MAFLHSAQLLYTDCGYPRWSVCFTLPNAIFFYLLFNDFYKKSYNKPIVVKTSSKNGSATAPLTNGEECTPMKNGNGNGSTGDNKKSE